MATLRTRALAVVGALSGFSAASFPAQPAETKGTVSISGEARFEEAAPIFLQLLTVDASGKETVARSQIIPPTPEDLARSSLRFVFVGLAPRRYALKAFQDTNGNGEIDIGIFGPKEPWATYRDARPRFRPPRFEEMAFDAQSDVSDADVVLR